MQGGCGYHSECHSARLPRSSIDAVRCQRHRLSAPEARLGGTEPPPHRVEGHLASELVRASRKEGGRMLSYLRGQQHQARLAPWQECQATAARWPSSAPIV